MEFTAFPTDPAFCCKTSNIKIARHICTVPLMADFVESLKSNEEAFWRFARFTFFLGRGMVLSVLVSMVCGNTEFFGEMNNE